MTNLPHLSKVVPRSHHILQHKAFKPLWYAQHLRVLQPDHTTCCHTRLNPQWFWSVLTTASTIAPNLTCDLAVRSDILVWRIPKRKLFLHGVAKTVANVCDFATTDILPHLSQAAAAPSRDGPSREFYSTLEFVCFITGVPRRIRNSTGLFRGPATIVNNVF